MKTHQSLGMMKSYNNQSTNPKPAILNLIKQNKTKPSWRFWKKYRRLKHRSLIGLTI